MGESFPTKFYSKTLQLTGGSSRVTSKEIATPVIKTVYKIFGFLTVFARSQNHHRLS